MKTIRKIMEKEVTCYFTKYKPPVRLCYIKDVENGKKTRVFIQWIYACKGRKFKWKNKVWEIKSVSNSCFGPIPFIG